MTQKTLFDHCREWYQEQQIHIESLPRALQLRLYEIWVNYAFSDFKGLKEVES